MTLPPAPSAAPRWSTLVLLMAAVSGAHLALLLGPPAGMRTAADRPMASATPASALPGERHGSAVARPAAALPVARVSTVRWVVQPPAAQATANPLTASALGRPAQAPAPRPDAPDAPLAPLAPVPSAAMARTTPPSATPELRPQAPAMGASAADTPPGEAAITPAEAVEPATVAAPAVPLETPLDASPATADESLLAAVALPRKASAAPASAAQALPPAEPPASTRLDYAVSGSVKGLSYNAEGRLDWTLAEGRYSARMEMRVLLLGSRVQTSTGLLSAAGLLPERFADRSRSEKAAHFDREQNRIRFSNNAPEAVLQPGAQDRLSLFLQLAGLLQARPEAYLRGQVIDMQVAGTGDADMWRFEVGEEVTLALPAGEVRARHLRRLPRREFDSTVEMWLAPALQHLPVRLRVTQPNGDMADQQISRLP